jgi:hypothetical protein
MKTKLLLSLLLSFYFCLLSSQVPQGFNYQAIARDASTGNVLVNTSIQVDLSILSDTLTPVVVWEELFSTVKTNSYGLFVVVIGTGSRQSGVATFADINWSITPLFIKTQIYYSEAWKYMGTAKLWSVPYSMVAGDLGGSVDKLEVTGKETGNDDALFEVKNKFNKTVFAVYNEGVRVYVDKGQPKSAKGGFAIGGFSTKGEGREYLRVDPGNINMYIDDIGTKSAKGGFAIGGFSTKGGSFFNVDAADVATVSANRVLWYPLKNAFLAGNVLITDPANVGLNSFATGYQSMAKGQYSQAMGYQAQAIGDYSTAIGKNALANVNNSFAFGEGSTANYESSYAFGKSSVANGSSSYAFGENVVAGSSTNGNCYAFGKNSQATGTGSYAFGDGAISSGLSSYAFGSYGHEYNWTPNFQSNTMATGDYSFAAGQGAVASSNNAISIGFCTNAYAPMCIAMGFASRAGGNHSAIAMGEYPSSTGQGSVSMGFWTVATNTASIALGLSAVSTGYASVALGNYTTSNADYSTAIGRGNLGLTNSLFEIGNGDYGWGGTGVKSNVLTVLNNGNMGLGTSTPSAKFEVGVSGTTGYDGIGINSSVSGGKLITINQGTPGKLTFTQPGVTDLVTFDFNSNKVGIRSTDPNGFTLLTGNDSYPTSFAFGRSALEGNLAIASANGEYSANASAGDVVLRNMSSSKKLILTTGAGTATMYLIGSSLYMGGGAWSNGVVWTNGSDKRLKDNFEEADGAMVLEKISKLPVLTWNYKCDNRNVRHMGPTAQDFYAKFGLGNDTISISTIDPAGISLAAIKELNLRNNKLNNEVKDLKDQLEKLGADSNKVYSIENENKEQKHKLEIQQAEIETLKTELEQIKVLISKSGIK